MPEPPLETNICLPFIPYLIEAGEEEEVSLPGWGAVVKAAGGMFRAPTPPHSKSNMNNLLETLKTDWKVEKTTKYIYPELTVDEEEDEEGDTPEGIYTYKVWVLCDLVKLKGFVK